MKHEIKISKAATIIIFIALIRTIAEPLRLQFAAQSPITFTEIRPFLLASLVSAFGLLAMTILAYYGKSKTIILVAIFIIAAMLYIKYYYSI